MRLIVILFVIGLVGLIAAPASAHEGNTHVLGTVTSSASDQLKVQAKDGKEISIYLTPATRYFATGPKTGSTPEIGDRVVVEVTKESDRLTANEVRFSTVQPKSKP